MATSSLFAHGTPITKHNSVRVQWEGPHRFREELWRNEGKTQDNASHFAVWVQVEGFTSTLSCDSDEAALEVKDQRYGSDVSLVNKPYPRIVMELSRLSVTDDKSFSVTKEKEGCLDMWSADWDLSDYERISGLAFEAKERSPIVELSIKGLDTSRGVCTLEDHHHNGIKASKLNLVEEEKQRNDNWCHDPNIAEAHQDLGNSSLPKLPYYSGWEELSIEEALQRMGEVHSEDDYKEKCVCLLQKCKRSRCLDIATRAYTHICANGLESHDVLGSYIVAMFVRCCSLLMAQQVFSKLCHHNEYSWTHLIRGYIDIGDPEHGLYLFCRMKEAGIQPSRYAYVAVLKACAALKSARVGQQIHSEIAIELEDDLYVGRALVDLYVKCGLCAEACNIFENLPRQVIEWESAFSFDDSDELLEDPIDFLGDVQVNRISLYCLPFVYMLKVCSSMKALPTGRELHVQIVKEGLELDHYTSNTLVHMYAKCGSLSEACNVLKMMSDRDVVSWTALIAGCVEQGLCEDALKLLKAMREDGVAPNAFTIVSCLKACGITGAIDRGQELHAEIMKEGLYVDFVLCNALVDMYANCGLLEEAQNVFDKLARQDIISWTSLLSGYTKHSLFKEALTCFEVMQEAGVSPNIVTFMCCLKACACLADLDMGHKLHTEVVKEEFDAHIFVGNTLLRMYARCGSHADARAIFEDLPVKDLVTWSCLIEELADEGLGDQALSALEQMQLNGVSPSSVTYGCSLKACSSIRSIDKGRKLHLEIVKRGLEKVPFLHNALTAMYVECGIPADE